MSRCIILFLVVMLAWAQFGFVPNTKALDRDDWSTNNSVVSGVVGKLGFLGGFVFGGLAGVALGSEWPTTEMIVGASIGSVLVESVVIFYAGKQMGFDGNYLSTALGSLLGTGAAAGLFVLGGQFESTGYRILIGIPAVAALFTGPVLGYYLGINNKNAGSTSSSVISYSSDAGLQLGFPLVQFSNSLSRGNVYYVSLLSGTF